MLFSSLGATLRPLQLDPQDTYNGDSAEDYYGHSKADNFIVGGDEDEDNDGDNVC